MRQGILAIQIFVLLIRKNILKNLEINKKHKGVRRATPGMNFESYAEKISSIRQIDIVRSDVNKVKFASIND